MGDVVRNSFAALDKWPLVQGAVAILVLVIAALLAWATLKRQLPPGAAPPQPPAAAPTPIQIESPWLVQHLVEMHLDIVNIKASLGVANNKIDGVASLMKRRERRRDRPGKT